MFTLHEQNTNFSHQEFLEYDARISLTFDYNKIRNTTESFFRLLTDGWKLTERQIDFFEYLLVVVKLHARLNAAPPGEAAVCCVLFAFFFLYDVEVPKVVRARMRYFAENVKCLAPRVNYLARGYETFATLRLEHVDATIENFKEDIAPTFFTVRMKDVLDFFSPTRFP